MERGTAMRMQVYCNQGIQSNSSFIKLNNYCFGKPGIIANRCNPALRYIINALKRLEYGFRTPMAAAAKTNFFASIKINYFQFIICCKDLHSILLC